MKIQIPGLALWIAWRTWRGEVIGFRVRYGRRARFE